MKKDVENMMQPDRVAEDRHYQKEQPDDADPFYKSECSSAHPVDATQDRQPCHDPQCPCNGVQGDTYQVKRNKVGQHVQDHIRQIGGNIFRKGLNRHICIRVTVVIIKKLRLQFFRDRQ